MGMSQISQPSDPAAQGKGCPLCGCEKYKTVNTSVALSLVAPRKCKECGHQYIPRVSRFTALAAVVIGIVSAVASPIAGAVLYFQFADEFGGWIPGLSCIGSSVLIAFCGAMFARTGWKELGNARPKEVG